MKVSFAIHEKQKNKELGCYFLYPKIWRKHALEQETIVIWQYIQDPIIILQQMGM